MQNLYFLVWNPFLTHIFALDNGAAKLGLVRHLPRSPDPDRSPFALDEATGPGEFGESSSLELFGLSAQEVGLRRA